MSRRSLLLLCLPIAVFAIVGWKWATIDVSPELTLEAASDSLKKGQAEEAYGTIAKAVDAGLKSPEALQLLAVTARRTGRLQEAVDAYRQLAELPDQSIEAHRLAAEICQEIPDLECVEYHLRAVLEQSPADVSVRHELATLMLTEGRHRDAMEQIFRLIQLGDFLLDELVMFGSPEEFLENRQLLEEALKFNPQSAVAHLGLGSLEAFIGNNKAAIEFLTQATQLDPGLSEAWAELGVVYHLSNQTESLKQWQELLPESALDHPDVQYVIGLIEESHHDFKNAVEAYAAALQLNPNHRPANFRIGNLLSLADESSIDSKRFLERASLLDQLERTLHRILLNERDLELMVEVADLMGQLGRTTEEWAWWKAIAHYHPQASSRAQAKSRELEASARTSSTATSSEVIASLEFDFDAVTFSGQTGAIESGTDSSRANIRFRDVGPDVGFDKAFFGGFDGDARALWIYEGFGGGVGVLDFDRDGRQDFYFVHGNHWPIRDDEPRSRNLLYRTVTTALMNCSEISGTDDAGFGQGVAIGDFDSDGFEDIYVANIGQNRLYRNNGDGTFEDATTSDILSRQTWTTSCLMADVNGDGFDDLFDVNYLRGSSPFTKECLSGPERLFRSCKPDLFEGDTDRLLLSNGQGGFVDSSTASGIEVIDGKGLGIVAADFDESGTLDLFVANDSTSNAFFWNRSNSNGIPILEESALLNGTALNGSGRVEACMGIAVGDVTNDGQLDLFVTNFFEETNTLYCLVDKEFFIDRTDTSGLGPDSFSQLSFGTQFLDADLDGDGDIVVVNGHVDDYSQDGIPWKMTPQVFLNSGEGRFTQNEDAPLGDYSTRPQLGRALARLDWNRDGMDDFVVTHLDRAPALLINETPQAGNSISFRLIGQESSRAGVGAILKVDVDQATKVLHQTAGDGYYCSNEKRLTLGLGDQSTISRIVVDWPSGRRSEFEHLTAGRTWLIVEGATSLVEIPYEAL